MDYYKKYLKYKQKYLILKDNKINMIGGNLVLKDNKLNMVGGEAESLCIGCGGPLRCEAIITNIDLLKRYLNKDIYNKIQKLDEWDNPNTILETIKKYNEKIDNEDYIKLEKSINIPKNHVWQNKMLLLTEDKIYKNVKTYEETAFGLYNSENSYLFHIDCYKVLETKYGKFKYDDINRKLINKIEYKIINKYQYQWFFRTLAYLEKPYLLESPIINKENRERILRIDLPIKINDSKKNSKKERPSPSKSATLYDIGTRELGNDNDIWIVKENKNGVKKWSKYNMDWLGK